MTQPSLDERVRIAMGDKVPGVALVIVGAEGVRARAAVGLADLVTQKPMATDLLVPWFSMTKIATATIAMRLCEREQLDLDGPVMPLVPEMGMLRPRDQAERITIRHLLQHAGGLANPIPVRWIHAAGTEGPDPDRFLAGILSKHAKLKFVPGSRSSYSNVGTLILGAAIARVQGTRFEAVAVREILEPLEMGSTGFTYASGHEAATGYHPRLNPMRLFLPGWVPGPRSGRWLGLNPFLLDGAPYGGLVGSADDAARFLQLHLRDGELDGIRMITADDAATMRRIDQRGKRFDLGLGWFRPANRRDADPDLVEHLGGGAGFFNVMRLYPSLGVGAVVMGNATSYDIDALADLALAFRS
jgi:CubicO group peptidase (beta-lactamase class C family)